MKKAKFVWITTICVILAIMAVIYLIYKEKNDSNNTNIDNINSDSVDIYENLNEATSENSSENRVNVTLEDNNIKVEGNGIKINGNTVNITSSGIYTFTGTLNDGSIIVDANKKDDVTIILQGVNITSLTSSVIYSKQSSKTVVELVGQNVLTDTSNYVYESEVDEEPSATIFSKDDLVITGEGTLNLNSNFTNSIFSKDGLVIESGNINIKAEGHGIKGRDYVWIKGGNINVEAGLDGIKTTNDVDEDKGYIVIENGNITVNATQDGISSEKYINIINGSITLTTGGGSKNVSSSQNWGMWGKNTSSTDEASAKAIKATGDIVIQNGTFNIDSSDDSIHSNANINIMDGSYEIASGDDGIHADTLLTIDGGKINITKSYEGSEAENITINDGDIKIVSSDDGINVNGGNDMSAMGGRPGQNNFSNTTSDHYLTINGGTLYVNASGDGLDSNGNIVMKAGNVTVDGPTNDGNGSLDYENSFEISGGELIAVGSSGMAQSVSSNSTVNTLFVTFTSKQYANSTITVKDSEGNDIIAYTPSKTYSSAVICNNKLEKGKLYTLYIDDTKMYDVTISDTINNLGSSGFGGIGNGMGRPGGMMQPMR